jgi:hypothetical protein
LNGKNEMSKKILFIYTNYSTFVKTDFEILASEHEVVKYQYIPVKGLFKTAVQFLKQFFYLLFNIRRFDLMQYSSGLQITTRFCLCFLLK